jgi:cytochrome d ubiquinol oxidase subunit I
MMGLIGTRSLTREVPGIDKLEAQAEERIRSGLIAYDALMHVRAERENADPAEIATFEAHSADLGFAFLLLPYVDDPRQATAEQITMAAEDTIPHVWPLFWAFRIMVGLGFVHRHDGLFLLWPRSAACGFRGRRCIWRCG